MNLTKTLIVGILSIVFNAHASTISVQDARLNKTVQITADEFLQPTPSPTIIIGHGCDGPASIKFFVSTVQSWGYNVVVPDSFGGRGVFETCGKTWVNRHQRRMDIEATSEWIMKQPWHKGKIGYMGFSHGGAGGTEYSNAPGTSLVSAVVAYYPWCTIPNYTAKIPTQIHVGSKDDWTGDDCSKLQGADVKVYPGVYHSFIYPKSYRVYVGHALAYDEQADRLAKEASQLFFKQHLKD
jgi:dienelactone hydrolase